MENSQIPTAQNGFAELTNDFMFKRIFAGKESNPLLIAFLNHFIGNGEITEATILNSEHLPPTTDDRKSVFDINVRTQDGSEYIIEMQLAQQKYFRERALFYSAYPILEQESLAKAEHEKVNPSTKFIWKFQLKPVRFLAVVNFKMEHTSEWEQPERYQSSYRLYEDTCHELLHNKLQFVFLELGRFTKSESELTNIYDKWMFLFKHMAELNKRPDSFEEKEFDKLFELANICNFTPEEYNEYENSKKMSYDYQNTIDFAKEEGREEEKIKIARNMLKKGYHIEDIMGCTGISDKDLAALIAANAQ